MTCCGIGPSSRGGGGGGGGGGLNGGGTAVGEVASCVEA